MTSTGFEGAVERSDYLLRVATSPAGRAYKAAALELLELRAGEVVVDLGCGPGTDLLALADAVGTAGTVLGVDHDEASLTEALRRTSDRPNIAFHLGKIEQLGWASGAADAVRADRVLQHVSEPGAALREAARVLRRGGRAVFVEPDWGTLVVDCPEARLTAAYTRYVTEHQVRNARIGSQLSRLSRDAGLATKTVLPLTTVFPDRWTADRVLGFHRVTERAVSSGVMTAAEARRWLSYLSEGHFFASVTLFVVAATKEGGGSAGCGAAVLAT